MGFHLFNPFHYICAMFKQSIAILFLFAFLTQTFSKAVIVCSFYANQDYIAKNLCENRNKPKCCCCAGKCQLRKKLNKDTNEDKQNNERKSGKETEVLSSMSFITYQLTFYSMELDSLYITDSDKTAIDKSYPIFHPPGA